jgi:hypothetical protein
MFGLNWGNGFITDYNIINSRGLSDPNPFFSQLVRKPYVGQVCGCGCGHSVHLRGDVTARIE